MHRDSCGAARGLWAEHQWLEMFVVCVSQQEMQRHFACNQRNREKKCSIYITVSNVHAFDTGKQYPWALSGQSSVTANPFRTNMQIHACFRVPFLVQSSNMTIRCICKLLGWQINAWTKWNAEHGAANGVDRVATVATSIVFGRMVFAAKVPQNTRSVPLNLA